MEFVKLDLGRQSGQAADRSWSTARLINCYPLSLGEEGVVQFPLVACAPLLEIVDGGDAGDNKCEIIDVPDTSYTYVHTNDEVFYTLAFQSLVSLGAQNGPDYGFNSFARNSNASDPQIAFIGTSNALKKIETTTVSTVSTAGLTSAALRGVVGHDGYIILLFDSGEWFIPSLNTMTYDPLDFTTFADPEGGYSAFQGGSSRGKELILFTASAMAFYRNTGAADFPYELIDVRSTGMLGLGYVRKITMPDGEDSIVWIATNKDRQFAGVCMLRGYQVVRISTPAVDNAILSLGAVSNSGLQTYVFTERGRTFFAIRSSVWCWVWDSTTGYWHERHTGETGTWDIIGSGKIDGVYQGMYSTSSGSILYYELSDESSSSDDKQIKVRTSLDNGATWRDYRTAKTIDGSSNYDQQFKWNRFGQSRQDGFTIQIDITNAVENNYAVSAGIDNYADTMTVVLPQLQAWPGYARLFRLEADVGYDNNPISGDTSKPVSLLRMQAGVKVVGVNR